MHIDKNIHLTAFNTFGFDAHHKGLVTIQDESEIIDFINKNLSPIKILGGGSNILITKDIDAYLLHNRIKGIEKIKENNDSIWVRVGGGEIWHDLVMWSIDNHLGGLENLSLIPGSVGAAPMQNIGAYGIEQNICFDNLEAICLNAGTVHVFDSESCRFGYRESVFKSELKDKYFITRVTYKLQKPPHTFNLSYGAIQEVLIDKKITQPTIQDVSNAIIDIRQSKLPDPKILGNAGSFFKNPIISKALYESLLIDYPTLPHYPISDNSVKVPAGWLIEQCGFKGTKYKNVGVHTQQALVLVHYGKGVGAQILELAIKIQSAVHSKFGIKITPEVNFW